MTPTVTAAAAATALAEAAFLSPAQGTHKEIPFQPLMHVGAPGTFPSDGAGCCRGHCGGCCPHVANTSPPSGAEADCACGFDAVLCFLLGGFCGGAAGTSAAAAALPPPGSRPPHKGFPPQSTHLPPAGACGPPALLPGISLRGLGPRLAGACGT